MAVPSSSLLSLLLLALLLLHHCSAAQDRSSAVVVNITAVEAVVRDRAFELLHRTDKLVGVPLTACPSACGVLVEVQASALRVRSSSLWADGVNATAAGTAGFTVPPRVVPSPFARRVDVVFERFLGNSSAALFAPPRGYALAAPVAALLAYDVSFGNNGSRAVALRALGGPVRVEFGNLSSPAANGTPPFNFNATEARCVTFAVASGKAQAVATHAMESDTACAVTGTGHYGVAVRLQPQPQPQPQPPPPPPAVVRERWWAWMVVAGAGGVVAVSFLAATVVAAVRWSRRRRREEMDLRALAGEELGRMAVRGSRMPAAKMARTRPELEDGSPLPWRR